MSYLLIFKVINKLRKGSQLYDGGKLAIIKTETFDRYKRPADSCRNMNAVLETMGIKISVAIAK